MNINQPSTQPVTQTPSKPFQGKRLAPFTAKNLFSRRKHQEILDHLNPLLNPRVIRGTGRDFVGISEFSEDFEIAESGAPNTAQTLPVYTFIVAQVGAGSFLGQRFQSNPDGTVTPLENDTVAFPWFLQPNQIPLPGAIIVPGLKPGDIVYAAFVGSTVTFSTGINTPWLWLNVEGMGWGIPFRFKDSSNPANPCAPMKCWVQMTIPVPDV